MAQRMRLVPEAEYNRFVRGTDGQVSTNSLEDAKHDVLDAPGVPDDVKTILYQDIVRRLARHRQEQLAKPTLVKIAPDVATQEPAPETTSSPEVNSVSAVYESDIVNH